MLQRALTCCRKSTRRRTTRAVHLDLRGTMLGATRGVKKVPARESARKTAENSVNAHPHLMQLYSTPGKNYIGAFQEFRSNSMALRMALRPRLRSPARS